MDRAFQRKLSSLRADYEQLTGNSFKHFFCPILLRDDDAPLCKAHIVNQAFRGSTRSWTVQREDVDGFYGSRFEADFIDFQTARGLSGVEFLQHKKIRKRFKPKVRVEGEEVPYFVANGHVPTGFTEMEVEQDGKRVRIALKMNPSEVLAATGCNWQFDTSRDLRVAALASLIKAAHLTAFEMLGYRYALSPGGQLVGRQILGEFFYRNDGLPKQQVLSNAKAFFERFAHMVRPVEACRFDLRGTISDQFYLLCWGNSGGPWALVVFIRIGQYLHAVTIPVFEAPEAVAEFVSFLRSDNETVTVSMCRFNRGKRQWEGNPDRTQLQWPKSVGLCD